MLLTLAIIFAFFLILSLLPFGIEIAGRNERVRVRLILAGFRVHLPEKIAAKIQSVNPTQAKQTTPDWRSTVSKVDSIGRGGESLWREFGLADLKSLWRALRILKGSLRFRIRQLDVCVATPDPALTGIVFGSVCASVATFRPQSRIHVYPDFTRDSPVFDYRVELSVLPLISLISFIRALMVLPLRKIVRVIRALNNNPRAEEVAQHV